MWFKTQDMERSRCSSCSKSVYVKGACRWVVTSHTHLQQQVFNPCSRIQVVTLLNVFLPGFPRIRLRIKLWTRSLRSVVGGRYPNLHFLSLHVLAPQHREQRGHGRGTGKNKLGPTDRYVELWNFELFWYSTYLPYFAGVGAWSGCPCKKKLGLTPPKINCRYYQECLLFNVLQSHALWSKKVCLNRFNKSFSNI